MSVAVADVVEVIAQMSLAGQVVENVFHFLNIGSTVSDIDALADMGQVLETIYANLTPRQTGLLSYTSIIAKNLDTLTDLGESDWPTLTVGSLANSSTLPTQVAGLVTFPTSQPKVRGRKFFPGVSEDDLTNGLFVSALLDALTDAAEAMLSVFAADNSDWRYVVLAGGDASEARIPTAGIIGNIPSTLTRRRIGTGE